MMMSIFRRGRPTFQLDHIAAMAAASTPDDVEMISWAFLQEKPTLVAIDDKPSIIQPQTSGDDGLSWEALFDVALTLREYRRLKEHQVDTPEDLGPVLYKITLVAELGIHPRVSFLLKAKDENAVRARLTQLVNEEEFRRQLTLGFVEYMLTSNEVKLVSAGALKVNDPAPADAPEYEFLTPDDD